MTDHDLPTRTEGEGETLDMPEGQKAFVSGQVLGERYQVLEMLGRGGMGEVWKAFDLKLRVEVALKSLRPDFFKSENRRELLRQEVRAAREVVSPNVCRIFDLIEIEGRELVSMEYVDGATLLGVLQERAPLDLKEAQDIASQFLAGLEAIHKVGLVHRDIKPENIMLTRAGRVVVMDFGLARQETEGGGSVSGTPAYMSPEQAAGETLDPRADVYSAGVVLAEMVSPDGIKNIESRQSVWEGVRSEPAKIPKSPWAQVIQKAVANDRERRFNTAHTLTRALEDVTLRVEGADDLNPYPGLASFTEDDAEYFFGREAEVEEMWSNLDGPPRLLALVGPSGAGKTSFLQAGLKPNASSEWSISRCTPGGSPFVSLGQALAPEVVGDEEAMNLLPRVQESDAALGLVSRWSNLSPHSLLMVDQFEELFTLNPPDAQQQFAELLSRLPLEADVHTLVSLRDDFLMLCNRLETLQPIVKGLTLLDPPHGASLRRALVQPAQKCGYRFEDDELVDEMLAEVEGERGALPLLAFAAARLWEQRDRETGQLTRQAYKDIGGVGGALAKHAEATIDRIGTERIAMVREVFRNLVTAEGTRAIREWDELLSVFEAPQRDAAEMVLRELIDSRLLTSYEIREDENEPIRRVEIIHESLLANWPRLVRWQTQDADAVQLRDQLRQAARTWDDQGRSDDTLWTGSAFREYASWRERFSGGLSDTEEAFALGMTSFAHRKTRRRRIVAAAALVLTTVVAAVFGTLWRRSELETRRARASKLVALGHQALEKERTWALAFALASLREADTMDGRLLALKVLWEGPAAMVAPVDGEPHGLAFSPDNDYLAAGYLDGRVRVFPRAGEPAIDLSGFDQGSMLFRLEFSQDSRFLIGSAGLPVRVWETERWGHLRDLHVPEVIGAIGQFESRGDVVLTLGFRPLNRPNTAISQTTGRCVLHRWSIEGGEPLLLGSVPCTFPPAALADPGRGLLAVGHGQEIQLHPIEDLDTEPARVIARHAEPFRGSFVVAFDPKHEYIASVDGSGPTQLWPLDGSGVTPVRELDGTVSNEMVFSPDGSMLAQASDEHVSDVRMWNLEKPAGTRPVGFEYGRFHATAVGFSPDSHWLATSGDSLGLALWPVVNIRSWTLDAHDGVVSRVLYSPDRSLMVTTSKDDGTVRSWPLSGGLGEQPTVLFRTPRGSILRSFSQLDPLGRFLVVTDSRGAWKVPVDGSEASPIDGLPTLSPRLSFDGRLVAAAANSTAVVVDLETGDRREIMPPGEGALRFYGWVFDPLGRLVVARGGILSRHDLETGATEVLSEDGPAHIIRQVGSRKAALVFGNGRVAVADLEHDSLHGPWKTEFSAPYSADTDFQIIASPGTDLSSIRIQKAAGGPAHFLPGDTGVAADMYMSPDGRWITTTSESGEIRLWTVPDLNKPPLHTLPSDELIARLEAHTNLRAIPDDEEPTGYRLEPDFTAYRGWAEVPEW